MKGHIRRRGAGSWAVVIDLDRGPDGKRRQKWHTVTGTKKQAEKRLTELLHSIDTGLYVEPSKLTISEFFSRWLEIVKTTVAGKTFERYEEIVHRHLVPAFGTTPLPKLTPIQVQSYYAKCLVSGRLDQRGGLSAQTVLHHHRVLKEAMQQAVRLQLLARNPLDAVDPPKPQRKEMRAMSEGETAWLLRAAQGTRLHMPILLTVLTGMRRGEVLALRWRDVDLQQSILSVTRSLEETREGLRFKEPKTAKGRRMISLPPLAVEALKLHREEQKKERARFGAGYQDNDLILCMPDGAVWKPESFTALYFKFIKRIGMKLRFHELRHTHASQLLRAGVSPKIVSERLGHSAVGITLDVYAHILPGMQEEAAQKIDGVMRKAMKDLRELPQ